MESTSVDVLLADFSVASSIILVLIIRSSSNGGNCVCKEPDIVGCIQVKIIMTVQ